LGSSNENIPQFHEMSSPLRGSAMRMALWPKRSNTGVPCPNVSSDTCTRNIVEVSGMADGACARAMGAAASQAAQTKSRSVVM